MSKPATPTSPFRAPSESQLEEFPDPADMGTAYGMELSLTPEPAAPEAELSKLSKSIARMLRGGRDGA